MLPRCCQTGCPDCPYGYKPDPDVPGELQSPREPEVYDGEIPPELDLE